MLLLIPISFVSGILTVFSPCVLPILPVILASGIEGNKRRIQGIIVGLVVSFTVVTLLLSTIVQVFDVPADTIRLVAVGLLVLLGIGLLFPVIMQTVQNEIEKRWHFQPKSNTDGGFGGGVLAGISLGIVWTPCVGPILAVVATLSAVSTLSFGTFLITLAFGLGTALPLYLIALGGKRISTRLNFFKHNSEKIRQVFGVVVLLTALSIYSGADRALQAWTLENLPESWTLMVTRFEERIPVQDQLRELEGSPESNSSRSINTEKAEKNSPQKQSPAEGENEKAIVQHVSLQNDFDGAKVAREDLQQGCPAMDCIPSIEDPVFESAATADGWLEPDDRVFAVYYKGVARAYPQRIMNWHEIVNDRFDDTFVAVTFCPLCGSAVAFERKVDGIVTEFGVSGKLHNSDLVMYDRYEGNLWQQITGEAIVGPAARREEFLETIPIITTDWANWKAEHPDTEVLSRDTGFSRDYGRYPYGTYEEDEQLLFGVPGLDTSLPIKTVVYGIELEDNSKAYPESVFENTPVIEDTISSIPVRLERLDDGTIAVTNLDSDEAVVPTRLFWFAWAAFHPDTELYQLPD